MGAEGPQEQKPPPTSSVSPLPPSVTSPTAGNEPWRLGSVGSGSTLAAGRAGTKARREASGANGLTHLALLWARGGEVTIR